ncbi:MAG: GTPase Era [Gammaproteobacteria bacterium]|nr:GTPase Era [Gammaproteobacteria bacterium]
MQVKGPEFKAGYVSIVGRPNVGKSTLLNRLIDHKISIVTRKPQTTRWQIRGIKSTADYQVIFTDTPGYQNTHKDAMNRYMNREVINSLSHTDVVLFVVEALKWGRDDALVAEVLKEVSAPTVLVINKLDLHKEPAILLP